MADPCRHPLQVGDARTDIESLPAAEMLTQLQELRVLEVGRSGRFSNKGVLALSRMPLTHLYLMGCVLVFSVIYLVVDPTLKWPAGTKAWLVMVGVVATYCLAISSFYAAISMLTPTRTSMLMNVEPIITIAAAALILGEALGDSQYLGAVIVVGAILAVSILGRPRAPRAGRVADG